MAVLRVEAHTGHRDEEIPSESVLDNSDERVGADREMVIAKGGVLLAKENTSATMTGEVAETEDAEAEASAVGPADTAPHAAHGEARGTPEIAHLRGRGAPVGVVAVM